MRKSSRPSANPPMVQKNDLERAIGDYLASVRAKGGSPRTEGHYADVLGRVFLPWARGVGITSTEQLDQPLLDRFNVVLLGKVSERTGKALSKASVANYLRHIRPFVNWCKEEKLVTAGLRVQQVRVPRKVLNVLSRTEINEMESAAAAERDKLIIRILGDCGLRLGELLALTPEDLMEEGRIRYLRIRERSHGGGAKGESARLVPLTPALYRRLSRYAERGRPTDVAGDRIFISLRRRGSGVYEPLDDKAVQNMLVGVAAKVGIRKPVNPHAWRHSFATNCLRGGMNPLALQKILGHRDLSQITGTYSQLVASDTAAELYRVLANDE